MRSEESNILYVAITRARKRILYSPDLVDWIACHTPPEADTSHRLPIRTTAMPDDSPTTGNDPLDLTTIAAQVASLPIRRDPNTLAPAAQRIRRFHPRANEPWTPEEDALLRKAWKIDPDFKSLAPYFQRQAGAVRTRARNLGL